MKNDLTLIHSLRFKKKTIQNYSFIKFKCIKNDAWRFLTLEENPSKTWCETSRELIENSDRE